MVFADFRQVLPLGTFFTFFHQLHQQPGARAPTRLLQQARQCAVGQSQDLPPPPELPSFTVEAEPAEEPSIVERHAGTGLQRRDAPLDDDSIDEDAAKVVRRLERAAIRRTSSAAASATCCCRVAPEDFDVATNARPDDVRALFRNCRIIGRRFRLAPRPLRSGLGRRGRHVPSQPGRR